MRITEYEYLNNTSSVRRIFIEKKIRTVFVLFDEHSFEEGHRSSLISSNISSSLIRT